MSASRSPTAEPRLPDRYRVLRHIASGGMASVWCAEDRALGRQVAIKLLAPRLARDETAAKRFEREARAAARVANHPHVVTIFDIGDGGGDDDHDERDLPFIVMAYMAGGTVAGQLRAGGVRRQEALRWLREAASAIDHGHALGVVHRDIKPANLLLDRSRVLHVADFGIARLASEDTLTSTGELVGTASYLSPEQVQGAPATDASDRYALAVVAFELLTGELPFRGEQLAQARQHLEAERPRASRRSRTVPWTADEVLIRGMAKDPAERYESSTAFVDELELALEGRPLVPPPRTLQQPVPSAEPRSAAGRPTARRAAAAIALAAVVIIVAGMALGGLSGSPTHLQISARDGGSTASGARTAKSHPAGTGAAAKSSSSASSHARPAGTPSTPAAGASHPATPGARGTTPPSPAAGPPNAAQLQLSGHDQLLAGNYQAAIATLRRAIAAASPDSLVYAYALYDLGHSLLLAGDPAAAVPVLERRLQIPNQTDVVRQLLLVALRASGQAGPPDHGHGRGHAYGHDKGGGQDNGGAGVNPFLRASAES